MEALAGITGLAAVSYVATALVERVCGREDLVEGKEVLAGMDACQLEEDNVEAP